MNPREDLQGQSDKSTLLDSLGWTHITAVILVVLVILLAVAVGGRYLMALRRNTASRLSIARTPQQIRASQAPTHTQTFSTAPTFPISEPTVKWATYQDTILKFKYPAQWRLFKHPSGNYYSVADDLDHPQNEFRIDIRKIERVGRLNAATDDQIIEEFKNYEKSSTANLGNFAPSEITKTKTIIDGRVGLRYVFELRNPVRPPYDQVTWIFIPRGTQLIVIFLEGTNQQLLEQILSTFKFTE